MCDPTVMFAASTAMSLASAAVSAGSKSSAYGRSIAAANAEADAINKSTVFKYATQGLQEQQIQNEGTIKEGQARLKLSGAEGEAAAAAGSGGVTGNSVRQLYRSFNVAAGNDVMNIEADEQGKIAQAQSEKRATQMSAQNQILGIKERLPQDPSTSIMGDFLGAALGVGKAFMANTTKVPTGTTGGLFGGGGILGLGRDWG
jgi:hypothetical protein